MTAHNHSGIGNKDTWGAGVQSVPGNDGHSGTFEHSIKLSPAEPEHRWSSVGAGERIFCIPYLVYQALALFPCTDGTCLDCTPACDDAGNSFPGVY
jgi:hypothetical protein